MRSVLTPAFVVSVVTCSGILFTRSLGTYIETYLLDSHLIFFELFCLFKWRFKGNALGPCPFPLCFRWATYFLDGFVRSRRWARPVTAQITPGTATSWHSGSALSQTSCCPQPRAERALRRLLLFRTERTISPREKADTREGRQEGQENLGSQEVAATPRRPALPAFETAAVFFSSLFWVLGVMKDRPLRYSEFVWCYHTWLINWVPNFFCFVFCILGCFFFFFR